MGQMYSNNLDVDFQNNTVDIAQHDGAAEGLKLGGVLVTASAAELNAMDGVVATAAELNQKAFVVAVTLGTADDQHIVIPFSGTVSAIYTVIDRALTTADEVLQFKNNAGSVMGSANITITQSGSADGDIDSSIPATNAAIVAGQKMTVAIGGQNGTAAICNITVVLTLT